MNLKEKSFVRLRSSRLRALPNVLASPVLLGLALWFSSLLCLLLLRLGRTIPAHELAWAVCFISASYVAISQIVSPLIGWLFESTVRQARRSHAGSLVLGQEAEL